MKMAMRMPSLVALRTLSVAVLLLVCHARPIRAGELQPYRVDDIFRLENLERVYAHGGPCVFAPDGQALAIVRARARNTASFAQWRRYVQSGLEDVYVQLRGETTATNITQGVKDGSGWFSPQWSPDGSRLAMVSTRGNGLHLWLWDTKTKQLRQISKRPIAFAGGDRRDQPYVWLDTQRLLYTAALEDGQGATDAIAEPTTMEIAPAEWRKFTDGQATASPLDSGLAPEMKPTRSAQLRVLDLHRGEQVIAERIDSGFWVPSPDGRFVSFLRRRPRMSGHFWAWQIAIADLQGRVVPMSNAPADLIIDSVRWSPDGSRVAFLGYVGEAPALPQQHVVDASLYRFDPRSGQMTVISLAPLKLVATNGVGMGDQVKWTASGDLILRATTPEHAADFQRTAVSPRLDWWRIDAGGHLTALTDTMTQAPSTLWAIEGRRAFVGIADGMAWRVTPATGSVEPLTQTPGKRLSGLAWPTNRFGEDARPRLERGRTYQQVFVQTVEHDEPLTWQLDLMIGAMTAVHPPAKGAELVAFSPRSRSVTFSKNDRTGLFLWRLDPDTPRPRTLVEANLWLQHTTEAEFRMIEYTSQNGETLRGGLLLPSGYEPGVRYPLITVVYLGDVITSRGDGYLGISVLGGPRANGDALNFQIAASRGYAVLFPSMPLPPCCIADDTYLRLTNGVIPAIDKTVELGLADPDRLFVMGHSFGGYSTYGLVTLTDRFKAAAALNGANSNPISAFGTFNGSLRYTSAPQDGHRMETEYENGQSRMGATPWQDPERYLRNTPLLHVHRVETPLLMIHGDMDFVPLMQAEEFFTALHHDDKRAQLVRYWGEEHMVSSPANVRDMWSRIFAWFDEFGDIQRDSRGTMIVEGNYVKSRRGAPPLKPADFLAFDRQAAPADGVSAIR
jgi:dipeptidyl aminopeptidase/acylaminoacyl peptidase